MTQALAPRPTTWARATLRPVDLAGAGGAAELVDQLDDLAEGGGSEGLAFGQQAAGRVDRAGAADVGVAVGQDPGLLTRRAESELLPGQQLPGGVGVLTFHDIDLGRSDAGSGVGVLGGEGAGPRDLVVGQARHRRGLGQDAAGQVGPEAHRPHPHTVTRRPAQHHGRGPFVGRAQHPEVQRVTDDTTGQDGLGGHRLLPHGVGVVDPVGPVLHADRGQVVFGQAGVGHQALGPEGEVGGSGGEAGLFLPRGEERRADDPLRHLLDPEHEHRVVLAVGDGLGTELEGRAAAGTARLDVDDRCAGQGQRAEHAVARRHAAVGRPAVRGLEATRPEPRLGHRLADGGHPEVDQPEVVEPPERVHPHPGDLHLDGHSGTGAKAQVATWSPRSSVTRVMRWPWWRRDGSDSVRRVTTRRPMWSNSTTPKP